MHYRQSSLHTRIADLTDLVFISKQTRAGAVTSVSPYTLISCRVWESTHQALSSSIAVSLVFVLTGRSLTFGCCMFWQKWQAYLCNLASALGIVSQLAAAMFDRDIFFLVEATNSQGCEMITTILEAAHHGFPQSHMCNSRTCWYFKT